MVLARLAFLDQHFLGVGEHQFSAMIGDSEWTSFDLGLVPVQQRGQVEVAAALEFGL